MTKAEKIAYAKSFLDSLAAGIDPTTKLPIPAGDVARNERLSKCFAFVSEILSEILNTPEENAPSADVWHVTPEVVSRMECSPTRVSVSTVAQRINNALNSNLPFTAFELNLWLLENGYLTKIETEHGKTVKRPTQKGIASGFSLDETVKKDGEIKQYVRCNQGAQYLMRDSLSEIVKYALEFHAKKRAEKRSLSAPFEISKAALSRFAFSDTPLLISAITEQINSLLPEGGTARLKATEITAWLSENGYLAATQSGEKTYRLPTDLGNEIGIRTMQRKNGLGESFSVALYDKRAQIFLIRNLYRIVKVTE